MDKHIKAVRSLGMIPHVAAQCKGSTMPDDICQSEGYAISLKIRKRIEEVLGWIKTVGGMRKLKLVRRNKISGQLRFIAAICNLVRIRSLAGGWRRVRAHRDGTSKIRLKQADKNKRAGFTGSSDRN